jgi:hypothetical protein
LILKNLYDIARIMIKKLLIIFFFLSQGLLYAHDIKPITPKKREQRNNNLRLVWNDGIVPNLDLIRRLIINGADPNIFVRISYGQYFWEVPLLIAIIDRLHEEKNFVDFSRYSFYDKTVPSFLEFSRFILKQDPNVDLTDSYGRTALTVASGYGLDDLVGLLLAQDANINHITKNLDTPLICAVKEGFTFTAQLLIENGADIEHKDKQNRTVGEIARDFCYTGTEQFLLRAFLDLKNRREAVSDYFEKTKIPGSLVLLIHGYVSPLTSMSP